MEEITIIIITTTITELKETTMQSFSETQHMRVLVASNHCCYITGMNYHLQAIIQLPIDLANYVFKVEKHLCFTICFITQSA